MNHLEEMDMRETQAYLGNKWAKDQLIRMSEGQKPNRTAPIDDIDIGIIRTNIFCVEDVWLHY